MLLEIMTFINDFLWNGLVIWFLLLAGLFFTIWLRFVQIRLFKQALVAIFACNSREKKQISSFQALCTSLAQRVGTGNLAGVATALTFGGEGAIFWMWVTAILGSSTAFAESTLAQVFKVKRADGTFHGGPAYYIHAGLRSKPLAVLFSISLMVALGFVFNGVQSNTIAQGLYSGFGIEPIYTGIALALLASLIIFGGRKRISRMAEILVPFMALSYLSMTSYVLLTHLGDIFPLFINIIHAAFSTEAAISGVVGYSLKESFRYGVARGLFSNEAGFGSAPNAAASADVAHPAQQGLVQMVAVFIDTIMICTSTAMLILLARDLDPNLTGIALTQEAARYHFGAMGNILIALAILLFGFTTILGNTFYGEANLQFITNTTRYAKYYRLLVLGTVIIGALLEVPMIWQMADLMGAIMVVINLLSIILLAQIVKRTIKDFEARLLKDEAMAFSFKSINLAPDSDYHFAFESKDIRPNDKYSQHA